jgi:3D (Asp-Asp-Asp) domain-containing protein
MAMSYILRPAGAVGDSISLKHTFYKLAEEKNYSGPRDTPIYTPDGQLIARVSSGFAFDLSLEGSGKLDDGRVVNYSSNGGTCQTPPGYHGVRSCYRVLDASVYPWGRGHGVPVEPLRSIAVDPSVIPWGSVIYIREFDGLQIPALDGVGGFTHDGLFRAEDSGGGIHSNHIDIYAGPNSMYRWLDRAVPTSFSGSGDTGRSLHGEFRPQSQAPRLFANGSGSASWVTATTAGALLVMGGLAMWWMSKGATVHGRAGARRNSGSRKQDAATSADILRDRRTGQYSHGFDAVCVCGHSKGSHLAEGTDCIVHEVPHTDADRAWVASHPDDTCACARFRKTPRRRNPKRDVDKEAIDRWAPGAKRRAEREKAQRDRWHGERRGHEHLLAKQAQWEQLEGHWILRVPGRSVAALPATGKKNAARFVVFDMNTREELAQLNKDEVFEWLFREAGR